MRLARLVSSAALFTLVQGGTSAAMAAESQPASGVSCDPDPECSRLADQASQHSQAGRYDEARRLYEAAYALRPASILLYNLGRVLHKAGRPTDAATYYQRYLTAGAEGSDANRQKTERFLEQARKEAGIAAPSTNQAATGSTAQPPGLLPAGPIGSTPTANVGAPGSEQATPIYKRWWLWTIVGVAAIGIGVGVGVGLAARRPDLTGAVEVQPF